MRAMFGVRAFQQASISPDGRRVAWVESLAYPEGVPSADSAIYLTDLNVPTPPKRITVATGRSRTKSMTSPGRRIASTSRFSQTAGQTTSWDSSSPDILRWRVLFGASFSS
jgi:dipeptidyl aminopeptidase/acylaminoacyl peptidase